MSYQTIMANILTRIEQAMVADATWYPTPNMMNALTNYQRQMTSTDAGKSNSAKIEKILEQALKHVNKLKSTGTTSTSKTD